jgi:hypothetical protein
MCTWHSPLKSPTVSVESTADIPSKDAAPSREDATANILSFSRLQQMGHSITNDEGERPDDDSFTIMHPTVELRFVYRIDGLYVHTHARTVPAASQRTRHGIVDAR